MHRTILTNEQLGPVIDETGSTATGKLVFSHVAWSELLGRSAGELAASTLEVLRYLEQRLLFVRVTLLFGWCGDGDAEGVGRLCICGVRM